MRKSVTDHARLGTSPTPVATRVSALLRECRPIPRFGGPLTFPTACLTTFGSGKALSGLDEVPEAVRGTEFDSKDTG